MTIKDSHAGTLESGDIMIQILATGKPGLEIELDSTVAFQFGRKIKEVIRTTAEELHLEGALIKAFDKGALDCTVRARVTAAVVRATGQDVWKD